MIQEIEKYHFKVNVIPKTNEPNYSTTQKEIYLVKNSVKNLEKNYFYHLS